MSWIKATAEISSGYQVSSLVMLARRQVQLSTTLGAYQVSLSFLAPLHIPALIPFPQPLPDSWESQCNPRKWRELPKILCGSLLLFWWVESAHRDVWKAPGSAQGSQRKSIAETEWLEGKEMGMLPLLLAEVNWCTHTLWPTEGLGLVWFGLVNKIFWAFHIRGQMQNGLKLLRPRE